MKCILIAIALTAVNVALGQIAPTPLGSVKDGVYFAQNGYSTTIIELKEGHFRYWFDSDAKKLPEPKFPLTGRYSTNAGTITLPHREIHEKEWTFMTHERKPTLWRRGALKYWNESKKVDQYGVLFPTDRKPEEIWRR